MLGNGPSDEVVGSMMDGLPFTPIAASQED